jgi:uncharacterized protein YxeA
MKTVIVIITLLTVILILITVIAAMYDVLKDMEKENRYLNDRLCNRKE